MKNEANPNTEKRIPQITHERRSARSMPLPPPSHSNNAHAPDYSHRKGNSDD